jgi:ribosomal protein S18 acetylase RimI-like enzyme
LTAGTKVVIRVRPARPEDWPRMAELDRQLARFERLPEPSAEEAARLADMIFAGGRVEALVAERDGAVEGMAIFWQSLGSSFRARPFLFLEDLVVSETARSAGVGEALMRELAREGVRRGVMRIEWSVLDWNVNAIRFYRRIGGGPQQDWIRYELKDDAMRRLARNSG